MYKTCFHYMDLKTFYMLYNRIHEMDYMKSSITDYTMWMWHIIYVYISRYRYVPIIISKIKLVTIVRLTDFKDASWSVGIVLFSYYYYAIYLFHCYTNSWRIEWFFLYFFKIKSRLFLLIIITFKQNYSALNSHSVRQDLL